MWFVILIKVIDFDDESRFQSSKIINDGDIKVEGIFDLLPRVSQIPLTLTKNHINSMDDYNL